MSDKDKIALMNLLREWSYTEVFIFDVILDIEKGMALGQAILNAHNHPEQSQWGRNEQ